MAVEIVRTFGNSTSKDQSAHKIKLLVRERERFEAVREKLSECRRKRRVAGNDLTSWLEPNSLSGLTPTGRGPGEGGQCQGLGDEGVDKNGEAVIAAREDILTNEMALLPSPCAGYDPRPGPTPEVKSVVPITGIRVSNCSGGDVESNQARTPWLVGPRKCGR